MRACVVVYGVWGYDLKRTIFEIILSDLYFCRPENQKALTPGGKVVCCARNAKQSTALPAMLSFSESTNKATWSTVQERKTKTADKSERAP